jgi:ERCC4-type nuclease
MATIIVDSRESRSGLTLKLQQLGAEVVSEELECGDYVLADGFIVERKAANDFVISIQDRRIFSQAAVMRSAYKRCVVVVEGDVFATRSAMTPEAIVGAISWLTVLEGIPVLTTRDTQQTAELLLTMQRHAIEGLKYDIALRGAKPKDRTAQSQYLVEGLQGIGPTAARKLLAAFGSAHAVFNADAAALRAVAGIGPKTVTAIRETLEFDTRQVGAGGLS